MRQLAGAALTCLASTVALHAQPVPPPGTLVVTGEDRSTPVSDTVRVRLGVTVRGASLRPAYDEAGTRLARVLAALATSGVPASQTVNEGLRITRRDDGVFEVRGRVTAEATGPGAVPALVDAAGRSGADDVEGPFPSARPDARTLSASRRRAVEDARRKAVSYAAGLGLVLGPVLSVSEDPRDVGAEVPGVRVVVTWTLSDRDVPAGRLR